MNVLQLILPGEIQHKYRFRALFSPNNCCVSATVFGLLALFPMRTLNCYKKKNPNLIPTKRKFFAAHLTFSRPNHPYK